MISIGSANVYSVCSLHLVLICPEMHLIGHDHLCSIGCSPFAQTCGKWMTIGENMTVTVDGMNRWDLDSQRTRSTYQQIKLPVLLLSELFQRHVPSHLGTVEAWIVSCFASVCSIIRRKCNPWRYEEKQIQADRNVLSSFFFLSQYPTSKTKEVSGLL